MSKFKSFLIVSLGIPTVLFWRGIDQLKDNRSYITLSSQMARGSRRLMESLRQEIITTIRVERWMLYLILASFTVNLFGMISLVFASLQG